MRTSDCLESQLGSEGFERIMGLDEAGRGCLAGPVVAAGVILDPFSPVAEIADSKLLNVTDRSKAAEQIRKKARAWAIAWCDNREIDRLNILQASLRAMARCVKKVTPPPDYLLVDGNKVPPEVLIPSTAVVGGDRICPSIGAASILAKVWRDEHMGTLHEHYPEYGWDQNKGYPVPAHYHALSQYGITPCHRRSFSLRTGKNYYE